MKDYSENEEAYTKRFNELLHRLFKRGFVDSYKNLPGGEIDIVFSDKGRAARHVFNVVKKRIRVRNALDWKIIEEIFKR